MSSLFDLITEQAGPAPPPAPPPTPLPAVPAAPVHFVAEATYEHLTKDGTGIGRCLVQRAACGAVGVPGQEGWRTGWLTWVTCLACLEVR